MKERACERYISKNFKRIQHLYGLEHWDITVNLSPRDDKNSHGFCDMYPEYQKADITVFWEAAEDEDDLLDTLSHELEHLISAPYLLYVNAVSAGLNEQAKLVADQMFLQACELTRVAVRRMRDRIVENS